MSDQQQQASERVIVDTISAALCLY